MVKVRQHWNLFKWHFKLDVYRENSIDEAVVGINSNLVDNANDDDWYRHHFLMMDYDNNLSFDALKREIDWLQKEFGLGDAHIFESSYRHYNVFFFYEDMDYFDCLRIIHCSSSCRSFKTWRMLRREMTLRLSPKLKYGKRPEFVGIVKSGKRRLGRANRQVMNFVLGYLGDREVD